MSTVTSLLLDGPTCLECVAAKVGLTPDGVAAAMEVISAAIAVHSQCGRCRGCGAATRVFGIMSGDPVRRGSSALGDGP